MCFEGWIVSLELLTWYFIENCLWGDSTNFVPIISVYKFHVKNVSQNFYIFKCVTSSVSRPHRFIRIIVAGLQLWQTIKSHAVCRPSVNDERRACAVEEKRHHACHQRHRNKKGRNRRKLAVIYAAKDHCWQRRQIGGRGPDTTSPPLPNRHVLSTSLRGVRCLPTIMNKFCKNNGV